MHVDENSSTGLWTRGKWVARVEKAAVVASCSSFSSTGDDEMLVVDSGSRRYAWQVLKERAASIEVPTQYTMLGSDQETSPHLANDY